jgi:hypothetical protein
LDRPDSRLITLDGKHWSGRIMSIGLAFGLPTLLGYFADRGLKTGPVLTIVGALLGFLTGILYTLAFARLLLTPKDRDGSTSTLTRPQSEDSNDIEIR